MCRCVCMCWLKCKKSRALSIWIGKCYYFIPRCTCSTGTKYLWSIQVHSTVLWNFHFLVQEFLGRPRAFNWRLYSIYFVHLLISLLYFFLPFSPFFSSSSKFLWSYLLFSVFNIPFPILEVETLPWHRCVECLDSETPLKKQNTYDIDNPLYPDQNQRNKWGSQRIEGINTF